MTTGTRWAFHDLCALKHRRWHPNETRRLTYTDFALRLEKSVIRRIYRSLALPLPPSLDRVGSPALRATSLLHSARGRSAGILAKITVAVSMTTQRCRMDAQLTDSVSTF